MSSCIESSRNECIWLCKSRLRLVQRCINRTHLLKIPFVLLFHLLCVPIARQILFPPIGLAVMNPTKCSQSESVHKKMTMDVVTKVLGLLSMADIPKIFRHWWNLITMVVLCVQLVVKQSTLLLLKIVTRDMFVPTSITDILLENIL